ncbi:MAG TPA: DUF1499 domain-containing protein [Longimicrobiales bacterium]|nr:DUF1499 domain-containing protein [Longimicrobiales bacterium]
MRPLRRAWRGLTRNVAETSADADEPRLVGRTYAIPFERVWQAALVIARKRRLWRITEEDDREGVIRLEATTPIFRFVDDVAIHVTLDENAQTRVDMRSASRKGFADLGKNPRRVGRFFRALDRALKRRAPR